MSIDDKYQGYSNRETWLVAIWIANEQDAHEYWEERTWEMVKRGNRDGIVTLARELEEWCKERQPEHPTGMYSDLTNAAIQRVDWVEIVESHWRDCECDHYDPKHRSFSTRDEAIAQGLLIEVTEFVGEASFAISVAMTRRAWDECIKAPEGADCLDETQRIWDVFNDLWSQIKCISRNGHQSELLVTVSRTTGNGKASDFELKLVCGSGDVGEQVLTIMMPLEG